MSYNCEDWCDEQTCGGCDDCHCGVDETLPTLPPIGGWYGVFNSPNEYYLDTVVRIQPPTTNETWSASIAAE